jgi:hypothetical protein
MTPVPFSFSKLMGFQKLFPKLISAAQTAVTDVKIDTTLDKQNARFVGGIMYVGADPGRVYAATLIHETVHAVDAQNGWYMGTFIFTTNYRAMEGLAYGTEYAYDLFQRLLTLRSLKQEEPYNEWLSSWLKDWLPWRAGAHPPGIYNGLSVVVLYPYYGKSEDWLTKDDMQDVKQKLGVNVDYESIAKLFGVPVE